MGGGNGLKSKMACGQGQLETNKKTMSIQNPILESNPKANVVLTNLDPLWPNSNWRYLKVHWDEPSTIPQPDKVSPWKI